MARTASEDSGAPRTRTAFTQGYRKMLRIMATLMLALCLSIGGAAGAAQDSDRQQMKGLDEQVQEVKSDVLSIAADLDRLEEKLLFPSNTQVALFVSLADGETFRLDSVQISIDGKPVARHIYSFKELEALQQGGVQRIYTGNVTTGAHQLDVSLAGKLEGGRDYSTSGTFEFSKGVEPKLVGIKLAGPDGGSTAIDVGEW
jgi:hypothetical protein